MKKLLTLTALGTILMAADAMAAGFHLREQSAAAQGNAFAALRPEPKTIPMLISTLRG